MSEMVAEFNRLCEEFDAGHAQFMHYARQGRWAEARAINASMKILLERQKEIKADMVAAFPPESDK